MAEKNKDKDGVEVIINPDGSKEVKIRFFVKITDTVDYKKYLSDPMRNSKPYLSAPNLKEP